MLFECVLAVFGLGTVDELVFIYWTFLKTKFFFCDREPKYLKTMSSAAYFLTGYMEHFGCFPDPAYANVRMYDFLQARGEGFKISWTNYQIS